MADTSSLRDRAQLVAVSAATKEISDSRYVRFLNGATAAYDWLLGTAPAPISGRIGTYSMDDIVEEEDLADDAIYRRQDAPHVNQEWAIGVQHALMWARGKAETSPGGPFPEIPL